MNEEAAKIIAAAIIQAADLIGTSNEFGNKDGSRVNLADAIQRVAIQLASVARAIDELPARWPTKPAKADEIKRLRTERDEAREAAQKICDFAEVSFALPWLEE